MRDPKPALEVLNNTLRKRHRPPRRFELGNELILVLDVVRHHELREIARDFRGRSHFDDVTERQIRLGISLLHFRPLLREPELPGLEHQVCVLPPWHLMRVDFARAALLTAFERSVNRTRLSPIIIDRREVCWVEPSVEIGAMQRVHDGAEGGLRRGPAHRIRREVHRIRTRFVACDHRSSTEPRRVMRVDMDWEVGELGAQRTDELRRTAWFEKPSHVFDAEDVDPQVIELSK